jgi:hypothetical protein
MTSYKIALKAKNFKTGVSTLFENCHKNIAAAVALFQIRNAYEANIPGFSHLTLKKLQ